MMIKALLLILLIGISFCSYTQNNVGVGTLTPNPNAALEIESNDKGLLIPRLTTAQRNIFGAGLTNTENSMLVYDVNDAIFYYWKDPLWIPIPGVSTDDQNIDSVILNPDSTLTVYIEDGLSASVDLKTTFDNTDEQTLSIIGDSLEISNGNRVLFIDNDTTNEKIDSVTYQDDTLTVYEGNNTYKAEIIGGEWSDADKIGQTNFIYAKQALNNGTNDTVVITDDGSLGVGLANPNEKIQVDGNIRVGRITDGGPVQPPGPGNALYFSGGPDVSGIFDTDNSDWIGMGRFNLSSDVSELRIRLGDNQGSINNDAFVLGSALIGFHPWNEYFRVQSNGYVHIGTSALPAYPTNQLHLQGEINPIRVEGIQPGASTDSILTIDATGVIRKIPNAINGEWNDADTIGMNGFIYAKQALNNGTNDTVVISDNGNIGVGTSSPTHKINVVDGNIRVDRETFSVIEALSYNDIGGTGGHFIGLRAGGTRLAPTQPLQDLTLASFHGRNALSPGIGGGFNVKTDENHAPGVQGTYLEFFTTPNGSNLTNTRMVVKNDGNIGIGTINPSVKLDVVGDVSIGKHYDYINTGGAVINDTYGDKLFFSGLAQNSDNIYFSRYNVSNDISELRLMLGDNEGTANNDAFVIGSGLAGFHTWNEYFRVQSNGFVHIGTSLAAAYPTNQLHLEGEINPLRIEGVQQGAITDSVLTINAAGVVRKMPNLNQGEWNDADSIGMNNFIYAKQALNNGVADTVVVTDDGKMGIGLSNPSARLTIKDNNVTMFMAAPSGAGKQGISSDGDIFIGGESNTYIVSDMNAGAALGDIIFGDRVLGYNTNDAGTWVLDDEHMRIDGVTGNVGIGTNAPNGKLSVYGQTTVAGASMVALNEPHVVFNDAVGGGDQSYITGFGGGLLLGGNPADYFNAVTGALEPRIDLFIHDAGRVGINNSNPGTDLNVGDAFNPGTGFNAISIAGDGVGETRGAKLFMGADQLNFTQEIYQTVGPVPTFRLNHTVAGLLVDDNQLVLSGDGNVGIGLIAPTEKLTVFNGVSTGTYTLAGWVHASDKRLKTNVEPVKNALNIVKKLDGVYYNWKASSEEHRQIGFLAQDVKKILPEVVVGVEGDITKGETLGMAYQNIVPVLVEAIKEQQKEIEELKSKDSKEIEKLRIELEEIKKLLLSK